MAKVIMKDICTLITLNFILVCGSDSTVGFTRNRFLLVKACMYLALVATCGVPFVTTLLVTLVFDTILKFIVRQVILEPFVKRPIVSVVVTAVNLSDILTKVIRVV